MIRTKHILLGGGVAAAIYGISHMLKLNRLSNELETETKISIHKVSLTGIELVINVTLKNPTGGSMEVKHPFVKLIYKDTTLSTSQVKDVNIKVPKFSEAYMDPPIRISLGFMMLATKVPALLKEYRESGKLNLTVKTVTTINNKLPYTKADNITLGGGKQA